MGAELPASVVVPAITAPSSLACVRSLHEHGFRSIVVSDRPGTAVSRSRYCDTTVSAPSPHDNLIAYKDTLLDLAARPDVLTIFPVREEDIYALSKYETEFSAHIQTPWPSLDALRQVQDRAALFDIADRAGVPMPETAILDTDGRWDSSRIIKARYTLLADEYLDAYAPEQCRSPPGTTYVEPGTDLPIELARREMGHQPIVQEFVPDTNEYGFFALCDHGEAVATFQHRQIRAYNYAGGPSAYRESIRDPELERAGRRLLDRLEWHGVAMVEFLRDESTGEFKLMEINPRFWSSLPFTLQAGVDFPYYYCLLAAGAQNKINSDYETGLAGHLLRGEISYLHSVVCDDTPLVDRPSFPTAARDVLASLYHHPKFDILQRDDPLPFVQDVLNVLDHFSE